MNTTTIIGVDLAKRVFQLHGADANGAVLFRKKVSRQRFLQFFTAHPPCTIAMEACAGAHHWARELSKFDHSVKLIPPVYVKPFVKRQKNDMADAEAIVEAATRPTMRFVEVKSKAQQARAMTFKTRDLLVRQRTQMINALRGHLAEYGVVAPQGVAHINRLAEAIADPQAELPEQVRGICHMLLEQIAINDERISDLEQDIQREAKQDVEAKRLQSIPGIGPMTAMAVRRTQIWVECVVTVQCFDVTSRSNCGHRTKV